MAPFSAVSPAAARLSHQALLRSGCLVAPGWRGPFSAACGLRRAEDRRGGGCETGRRSAWLCPGHSQCPSCCWPWRGAGGLGSWSGGVRSIWAKRVTGGAPRSVGSQLPRRPLLSGRLLWLSGLRLLLVPEAAPPSQGGTCGGAGRCTQPASASEGTRARTVPRRLARAPEQLTAACTPHLTPHLSEAQRLFLGHEGPGL